jgi:hypothetical protein
MSIQSSSSRNSKTHADDATATRTKALFLSLFLSSFDSSLERKTRGNKVRKMKFRSPTVVELLFFRFNSKEEEKRLTKKD